MHADFKGSVFLIENTHRMYLSTSSEICELTSNPNGGKRLLCQQSIFSIRRVRNFPSRRRFHPVYGNPASGIYRKSALERCVAICCTSIGRSPNLRFFPVVSWITGVSLTHGRMPANRPSGLSSSSKPNPAAVLPPTPKGGLARESNTSPEFVCHGSAVMLHRTDSNLWHPSRVTTGRHSATVLA